MIKTNQVYSFKLTVGLNAISQDHVTTFLVTINKCIRKMRIWCCE